MKYIKYLLALSLPLVGGISLHQEGFASFALLIYAFGAIPLLELLLRASDKNMSEAEEEVAKQDRFFDYLLYITVPLQWLFLMYYLYLIPQEVLWSTTWWGKTVTMGILCGTLGINIGHELGHRSKSEERFLAKVLLLSSLYMHFYIEHNRGHHKNVSTDEDPASSRRNEPLQYFWFRSIVGSYLSAWKLEAERMRKNGLPLFSLKNEMLRFQLIQLVTVATVYFIFGVYATFAFLVAAFLGALLLETVNYIEHYGLRRKINDNGRPERVLPVHSWNSNHPLGRLLLFELSRHSDHHYKANRPYQILKHHDDSPQMPTGYPGMMILAMIPPLWFWVMNKRIDQLSHINRAAA
ncbi:MAG: alkane 1-monooxygenase [Cyclobacteriaceae bacterium]|nr:alkane 1-monooxygenase [Cyclobacteriaceae bacterium]MCH8517767.1 alkane 1-monooxygenase [Cyclobacteriaceae bacterium]